MRTMPAPLGVEEGPKQPPLWLIVSPHAGDAGEDLDFGRVPLRTDCALYTYWDLTTREKGEFAGYNLNPLSSLWRKRFPNHTLRDVRHLVEGIGFPVVVPARR